MCFWVCFLVCFLVCFWDVFGICLVCFWDGFGMFLGCVWYVFGMFFGMFWGGSTGGPLSNSRADPIPSDRSTIFSQKQSSSIHLLMQKAKPTCFVFTLQGPMAAKSMHDCSDAHSCSSHKCRSKTHVVCRAAGKNMLTHHPSRLPRQSQQSEKSIKSI